MCMYALMVALTTSSAGISPTRYVEPFSSRSVSAGKLPLLIASLVRRSSPWATLTQACTR